MYARTHSRSRTRLPTQVCGDAKYTDDVPMPLNTLHAALVTSSRAHAKLLAVDAAPALEIPGVYGFYGADDVPAGNDIGPAFRDELVFAVDEVTCVGHVIGIVLADTRDLAKAGAAAVQVHAPWS